MIGLGAQVLGPFPVCDVLKYAHLGRDRRSKVSDINQVRGPTLPSSPTLVLARIPQMDWRPSSLVHQLPLVGQGFTPDQVAES